MTRGPYSKKATTAIGRMRLQAGITQVEAAKRCGVSYRTYKRAEAGDVVTFSTKRAIEARLGLFL